MTSWSESMRGARRADVLEREVRDRRVRCRAARRRARRSLGLDVDTVRRGVRDRRLDGDRIVGRPRAPVRSRASPPRSRARRSRIRRRAASRAAALRAARGRAASSDGRRSRTRGPGSMTTAERVVRRLLPRRADPERPDPDAVVKLAPAIFPALGDVDAVDVAERSSGSRLARRVGVRRQLDAGAVVALLEALPGTARASLRAPPPRARRGTTTAIRLSGSAPSDGRAGRCRPRTSRRSRWPRSASSSSRCSGVSRRGMCTFTSTRWSPRPAPESTGMPCPRRTRTSPGCVPGSSSSSRSPSSVATVSVAPSARLGERDVDGREDVVPLADEARIRAARGRARSVACHAARRAGMALPRDPDPLAIVDPGAGSRRRRCARRSSGPLRRTSEHGVSITLPMPPHAEQVCVRTNSPKAVRDTCCSRPIPPHFGQLTGVVPGSSAVAVARLAGRRHAGTRCSASRPSPPPTSSIVTSAPTSAPRRPRPPAANRSSPKNAEKRSEMLPEVERSRDEAAALQALEAVTVVELPSFGAGEHLVGLHDLLELLVGVRGVRYIRMELAREPTERLLDGRAVRVAADAEHVVVVPLHVAVSPRRRRSRRGARAPRQPSGQT